MTRSEAVRLTEQIRGAVIEAEGTAERAFQLLARAKATGVWRVLGYSTFGEYVYTEFKIRRNTAWRRLTQALVSGEITEAAALTEPIVLSQREAQKLRPKLRPVADQIRTESAGRSPRHRREVAQRIVAEALASESRRTATPPPAGFTLCASCHGSGVVPEQAAALSVVG